MSHTRVFMLRPVATVVALAASVACAAVAPVRTQALSSATEHTLHLRYASFDPGVKSESVRLPAALQLAPASTRVWIAQFEAEPTAAQRSVMRQLGVEFSSYLPENAYVVRLSAASRARVSGLPVLRSLTPYHKAFRIDPSMIAGLLADASHVLALPQEYNLVLVDRRRDRATLIRALRELGARVDEASLEAKGILLRARMTPAQVLSAAGLDEVLWIDRHSAPELDMDNARRQGGAVALDAAVQNKYRGKGVLGHVFEGVDVQHQDFTTAPVNVASRGEASSHGHCVAGIIFGNGKSSAAALGLVPEAECFYTTHTSATESRKAIVSDLVQTKDVMFTTSAWGHARTKNYTSISAEVDNIIFEHDIVWSQLMSNSGKREARPEAWSKNVLSVGSVEHGDNAVGSDDSWRLGGASHGPALDGRIKPDLVAYDDRIHCSDVTGGKGYSNTNSFTGFGGTAGATAIVSGYNAIAMHMFADGVFSPKRKANGTLFENRPHAATLKALQIASAKNYALTSSSTDNRREHVGWGFPDVKTMYDARAQHFVVDETDVIRQGDGVLYKVDVAQNQPFLKIVLAYTDVDANPSALRTRVNDLSLRVKAPNGTTYWGNNGLLAGNVSTPGGSREVLDNVESVFLKAPMAGTWEIEVGAWLVVADGHPETQAEDVSFALVSVGGAFRSKSIVSVPVGAFALLGAGCPTGPGCTTVGSRNWTQTSAKATSHNTRIAILEWQDRDTTVCGIDLYMGPRGATPVDVTVSLRSTSLTTALPDRVLTSASIRVDKLGTQLVRFSSPVTFTPSDLYFIEIQDTDKLELPISTTGETRFHHDWLGSSWSTARVNTLWQYRIHGITGRPVPTLGGEGDARIGKRFSLIVSNVAPQARGLLLFGLSDTNWGALKLPIEYEFPCSLRVSGEVLLPIAANAQGLVTIPLDIPFDMSLVKSTTYHQALILDAQNRVGFAVSNSARLKIGL